MANGTITVQKKIANITGRTDVTIEVNGVYAIGQIVIFTVRFTVSAEIPANNFIIEGLPAPLTSIGAASGIIALACNRSDVGFSLVGNGSIVNTTTLSARMYCVSGCYIAA